MIDDGAVRVDRLRATDSYYGARRAERPSDVRAGAGAAFACPFCPGNEALTGTLLTADPGLGWQSRVVANIYPAVIEPAGRHEVIIETRDHDALWPALSRSTIRRILALYRERERIAYANGYAFAAVFKNSGRGAGASLAHPHAQVVALRAVPAAIIARIERLADDCPTCIGLGVGAERIVTRSGDVVAYSPNASRLAFEVRFAPLAHAARFSACSEATLDALAVTVQDVLRRLARTLGEAFPFNMIVQSAPRDPRAESLMHWELEIVPRTENFGGFEVGTGGFLVSRTPEDAARILRAAEPEHA